LSHSRTKIWIHAILGTKEGQPFIRREIENQVYEHIRTKLENEFDCSVRIINGSENHIHILFLLSPLFSIKDIMHNIKGETSHWINQNDITNFKFSFQIGYGAFSVSESKVKETENYIRSQKEHHKKHTFKEEYELFMKRYGLEVVNRLPAAGRLKRLNIFFTFCSHS